MIGIELDRPCGDLVKQALAAGLLINVTADKVVRLLPPLVMSDAEGGRTGGLARRPDQRVPRSLIMVATRHFLQIKDLARDELDYVFERTRIIKARFKAYQRHWPLQDRTLVMIFEKASTRTRLSFEAGMHQLGGSAIYLNTRDSQLGRGEPVEDAAEVISRMSDIVMIRTYEQAIIERFASHSRVPVINGLTNEYHPCQILADIFTFIEHRGAIQGRTVAWIGDSNNVCNTWLQAAEIFDFKRPCVDPARLRSRAERAGLHGTRTFQRVCRPDGRVRGADLVTTDVWTSMGFEAENEERLRDFADWQVDAEMMRAAKSGCPVHALPARASRRGSRGRSHRRPAQRGLGRG
jgi:ornithine carbamoyltransferase